MTPSQVRDEIVAIQERVRNLETEVEKQKVASAGYIPICHELTESWEALERGLELTDEMAMGLS